MRGNYNTRFGGGQNLTAVEGNASVYQVYAVSRTTSEERTECSKGWGVGGSVIRLSLGKLSVNLLQVVKRTNTPLIP